MFCKFKVAILVLILLTSNQLLAKKNKAQKARENNLAAVTIFVDISVFGRKDRSAKRMTEIHQQFADHKYQLIGVVPYNENGDLEGFFVSYVSILKPKINN